MSLSVVLKQRQILRQIGKKKRRFISPLERRVNISKVLECSVDNCNNTSENTTVYTENCKFGRDLCERHYNQMLRLGKILKRTRYDPNEIVKYDDYAEVVLYNNDGIEVARTKIDLEDIKKIKEFKWYRDDKGYAFNGTENRKMHRVILDLVKYRDSKIKVDHINGDPLDNSCLLYTSPSPRDQA